MQPNYLYDSSSGHETNRPGSKHHSYETVQPMHTAINSAANVVYSTQNPLFENSDIILGHGEQQQTDEDLGYTCPRFKENSSRYISADISRQVRAGDDEKQLSRPPLPSRNGEANRSHS